MPISNTSRFQPIPIRIVVEAVEITGDIVSLLPNDMSVVILSPVSGLGTGLHVPWFMAGHPQFRLATESGITERGRLSAEWLLRELYKFARGRPTGWGIDRIGQDGKWTRVNPNQQSV